jgi:hypothetical protein
MPDHYRVICISDIPRELDGLEKVINDLWAQGYRYHSDLTSDGYSTRFIFERIDPDTRDQHDGEGDSRQESGSPRP